MGTSNKDGWAEYFRLFSGARRSLACHPPFPRLVVRLARLALAQNQAAFKARHAVMIFIHKSPSAKGALDTSLGRRPRFRAAAIREGQGSVPYRETVRGGG